MTAVQARSRRLTDAIDLMSFGGVLCFLGLLPVHLVIKKMIPGPAGTYWKELLLGALVLLWGLRSYLAHRPLRAYAPLDGAVLLYMGVVLFRFVVDRSGWLGAWGLYISVMYLPLYWLVPAVLQPHPRRLVALTALLVAVGALVALGGLAEFAWDIPLWPSDEMAQRQGFPSMFIYGTHVRRVYFTFDSPTSLANTLAVLLPMALGLGLVSRGILARAAVGLAAALTVACIVVTFSRGIWLATVLSLAVMGVWFAAASRFRRGALRRSWRPILVIGGVITLMAIAWGTVWLARRQGQDSTYRGVMELSPSAYKTMPVTHVSWELLSNDPIYGAVVTQTWSVLDPITSQPDVRGVLCQHPPESGKAETIYSIQVPDNGALRFGIAMAPEVWSPEKGDGTSFRVYVSGMDTPQEGQFVFVRYVNPKYNINDRRWRSFVVDLSPWARRTIRLSLITDAGPSGDWTFDWAGWAEPQIIGLESDYIPSSKAQDAIVHHTRSVLDWVRDETNRDRLAAWSQALNAWRNAPLWGTGLGSTGAAALRTHPEDAFVTESQVLKALVELGPLGFLVVAYLWFQIARTGYRTCQVISDPMGQTLLLGVLASLLIVFFEGLVYQNLEVKQVNAYFWMSVGITAYFAARVTTSTQARRPTSGQVIEGSN